MSGCISPIAGGAGSAACLVAKLRVGPQKPFQPSSLGDWAASSGASSDGSSPAPPSLSSSNGRSACAASSSSPSPSSVNGNSSGISAATSVGEGTVKFGGKLP